MSPKIHAQWDEGEFGLRSAGIMLDSLGRVLLCRLEDDEEVWWMIPGGSAELHETSEDTLRRENLSLEDFKRDSLEQLLAQQLVAREVSSKVFVSNNDIKEYHKAIRIHLQTYWEFINNSDGTI